MSSSSAAPLIFSHQLLQYSQRIYKKMDQWLPNKTQLHQAMRYAVLNGGKRIRPLLVYSTGLALGGHLELLDRAAGAVELIHGYSLIHDDLPSMDDDDFRRGQPTTHKAFDEATAILAGDALQSLAFEWLSKNIDPARYKNHIQIIFVLAEATGSLGMAGGQALDLQAEGKMLSQIELEEIHHLKTGALIRACVKIGALAAGCEDDSVLHTLDQFAIRLGLAYQIQDDILNIEGNAAETGKNTGTDSKHNKSTYPQLMGLASAKTRVSTLIQEAQSWLNKLSIDSTVLDELTAYLTTRRA